MKLKHTSVYQNKLKQKTFGTWYHKLVRFWNWLEELAVERLKSYPRETLQLFVNKAEVLLMLMF